MIYDNKGDRPHLDMFNSVFNPCNGSEITSTQDVLDMIDHFESLF